MIPQGGQILKLVSSECVLGLGDVGLVVEVADSTLSNERGLKLEVYPQAGIPEYWTVNLSERQLQTEGASLLPTE